MTFFINLFIRKLLEKKERLGRNLDKTLTELNP